MNTIFESDHNFFMELRSQPNGAGLPLHREEINRDLASLAEETFVRGVLAERFPDNASEVACRIRPDWGEEPLVAGIDVELTARDNGRSVSYTQRFKAGPWNRRASLVVPQLKSEGTLEENAQAYAVVLATRNSPSSPPRPPLLQPLLIQDQSLKELGVLELGEGSLTPDRPLLVNQRMVETILKLTVEAGTNEIGGAVLGKMVRLAEPLPGTTTRVVTVLSACVPDSRHVGSLSLLTFSPEALADADQVAQVRGLGETVITVYHSHGWGTGCGKCNDNEQCALAECTLVSVQDYQMIDGLVPHRSTVIPIAGRKLGADERGPVLEIHAWRGGQMRPIRWQRYVD